MNEQLGLVQRLRNGGQNDLADDAEGLWVSLYALSYLLGFASNLIEDPKGREAVLSAVNKAHAALAQASGQAKGPK